MSYVRKDAPRNINPWDMDINDLINVRSALDNIIEEMMNQTEAEKDARRQQVRKEQRVYEKQKEKRIKETKSKYNVIGNEEEFNY